LISGKADPQMAPLPAGESTAIGMRVVVALHFERDSLSFVAEFEAP
jgi:hypothetical protein